MKRKQLLIFLLILLLVVPFVVFISMQQQNVRTKAQQATPTTTVMAKNLTVPWALAFLPDGNILFTERTGKVKLLTVSSGQVSEITTISDVKAQAESGLLGLALHPNFATNNFVYLYSSYNGNGGTQNKVTRYTFTNNQLSNPTVIIDGIPGNDYHNGGRLKFGPDGFLYVTTGDGNNLDNPQDTNSLGGKILRVNDDGTAAPGNPFNNRTWSYGHRNPQGIAWDGTTMYETEHGPSQPSCCDEINRIEPGKNYGWPDLTGDQTGDGKVKNLLNSGQDGNNTWAPSGTTFYNGSLFYAGLRGEALFEATIQGDTATIKAQHFKNQFGRIRDVVIGPDNQLYILTNNKSSQGGSAQPEDDKIIKVSFGLPSTQPTAAPSLITPTIYCVGGNGQPPCAPIDTTTTPGAGSGTPGAGTPGVTNTASPTTGATTPSPTIVEPCSSENSASVQTNRKQKRKDGGGFIEQFFRLLLLLLMYLIGGGTIPSPSDPVPCLD